MESICLPADVNVNDVKVGDHGRIRDMYYIACGLLAVHRDGIRRQERQESQSARSGVRTVQLLLSSSLSFLFATAIGLPDSSTFSNNQSSIPPVR